MIIRTMMFIVAFLPFFSNVEAGFFDNIRTMFTSNTHTVPSINVLVVNDKPSVMIEVKGKYQLFDPNTKKLISKRFVGKKKMMQTNSSGIKWGEEFPGLFQLQIIPESGAVTTLIDGVEYRGVLNIYDVGGAISVVNRVSIEDFLRSSLPSKYPEPLLEEVRAAIAITARTNYYYLSQNPKNKFWAVDGQKESFEGISAINSSNEMDLAVRSTRHMVLSQTGTYEGTVTPFAARWGVDTGLPNLGTVSRISIDEAETIARTGGHAAQILSKAFPGSHIELIY